MKNTVPDLGLLVRKTTIQMNRLVDQFCAPYNLSTAQFNVINYVGSQPNAICPQSNLETALGIKRSATAIMVQRLEKKGMLRRIIVPSDRRKRMIKLSQKAIELLPIFHDFIQERQQNLLDNFSEEELQTVVKVLKFMGDNGQ
ncbi:MAG: MarR family transcriptional regulator [Lactobacillus sp.]|jgi:DNA-binding MarR family transcriptional regulator|nr:MarR family transcriptional regulator [Lactobacillus sp.]MCH3906666.1 MarR family transcriptional regulator [Lactobacillus sp.]MCH3989699.1 MarR family transcriptional regulator [Lactobacillus sp.]MCH4068135.1 MarR family transcriptional regulator [Lactobacillus sp.]MCI1304316.1 MarR family transcriptional regulator [Lactobacillus sp.]